MTRSDDPSTNALGNTASVPVANVEVSVVEGPDAGLRQAVRRTLRIGCGPSCPMRLSDPTVSRVHLEVTVSPRGMRVTDAGSTNGTFVDGVRIFDAELRAGAVLRLGNTVLRVEVGRDAVFVPVSPREQFGELLGSSFEMRSVYAVIERVAATEATVLVQGETGTGKELVARAIHQASARRDRPFIPVDCGAIAESLMEAELFGHVRGAFTGAASDRRGMVMEANGGTLFLDEIGELPLTLQPKLLRLLETKEVRAVGANLAQAVDVRVVAATNRPLGEAVNEGTFREDLYFRLAVVELSLPPLRARREDVPLLARHFWQRYAAHRAPFPEELVPGLMSRSWPGNVRELRNFIERTVTLGWVKGAEAGMPQRPSPAGLDALVPYHLPMAEARKVWLRHFDSLYLNALLRQTGGNVTRTAEIAGLNRRSLQRLMLKLGLRGNSS